MSAHPCADHPCDHCYCCEVIGICCQKISAEQRARFEADDRAQRDRLHAAIAQEARRTPSLPELVRQDAAHPRALSAATRLGLCPAPAADPLSYDSRKEAVHVLPARSN
jgi:hypothetical protein